MSRMKFGWDFGSSFETARPKCMFGIPQETPTASVPTPPCPQLFDKSGHFKMANP